MSYLVCSTYTPDVSTEIIKKTKTFKEAKEFVLSQIEEFNNCIDDPLETEETEWEDFDCGSRLKYFLYDEFNMYMVIKV